jgi:hypothetical protein
MEGGVMGGERGREEFKIEAVKQYYRKGVVGVTEAVPLVFRNVFLYPQTLQFVRSGTTNSKAAEILI